MKINNLKIKTRWDFKIFKKINFKEEREKTFKNLESFYQKWQKVDLKKTKNLANFIKDYERIISNPPGIFDREYLYYFLKSLLNVKDKKIKRKLEEIEKLREESLNKIFCLLEEIEKLSPTEREKIFAHPLIKNYKLYLKFKIFEAKYFYEIYNLKHWQRLKIKIAEEIKKHKEKLWEDRNLQEKVFKKYVKLGERAFNEAFKKYYELERKYKLPFGYYEKNFSKEAYQKIFRAIKKFLIENKKLVRDLNKKLKLKKEDLDNYLNSKISLKEAIFLIVESFNQLNKNFGKIVLNYFQKGLIDVFPKKNKYLIPRNISASKFLAVFILVNFDNTLKSLPQLIHELSHVLHTEYLRRYNSPLNANQSSIIREAIAYFFELFVLEKLKKNNKGMTSLWLEKIKLFPIFDNGVLLLTINEAYKLFKKQKHINLKEISQIYKKNLKKVFGKEEIKNISDYKVLLKFYRGPLWFFPYLASGFLTIILLKNFSRNKNFINLLKSRANKSFDNLLKNF